MTRHRVQDTTARETAVWMLGVGCGIGVSALDDAAVLPCGAVFVLLGAATVAGILLRSLLRPRRRVVVWEEQRWPAPGDVASPPLTPSGGVSRSR